MSKLESILVVTHVAYREGETNVPSDGPFNSVCDALGKSQTKIQVLELPLTGYKNSLLWGTWGSQKSYQIPKIFGSIALVKYLTDFCLVQLLSAIWTIQNLRSRRIVIGIDPLTTLPLVVTKMLFKNKLVFYSVDFNKTRFGNKWLQFLYEKADEIASKNSDQTWVVCQAIKDYKKRDYGINSIYIPNSISYSRLIYDTNKKYKTGNKMVWVGTMMTDRQYSILFSILTAIRKIRPEIDFVLAPTRELKKFRNYIKRYKLKRTKLISVKGRQACVNLVARCDVGIAIYDERFGSTEFIEPMKIWDFMLGGLPFVISAEPSLSTPIIKSGVAFRLDKGNRILDKQGLAKFITAQNLKNQQLKSLNLAKKFDAVKVINQALAKL